MKPIFKLALVLFFIPLVSFANNDKKKHEKSKIIKKEFSVNEDATVFIKNKYGNINVTTWNENRVEIEVKITVKGDNLDKVKDKLNTITVNFNASKSLVEARTNFEQKSSTWSWWGKSSALSYQVNYFVKMPITNNADFNNDYGSIILGELKGEANIDCDYGKISVEKLHNKTNNINLDYCSRSTINYMNSGDINIDYSKLTIDESKQVQLNSDYSTLHFGNVDVIKFNNDYGTITIDEAISIDGNSDYTNMYFGTVIKNLRIDTEYGGLKVKNLANGFESVHIDGNYSGIKISTNASNNFNFSVDLSYANFRYNDTDIEMRKSIKKSSKKQYEGTFGKGEAKSTVKISSSFGNVSIKSND